MAFVQNQNEDDELANGPAQTSAQSGVIGGGQQTQSPSQPGTPDKPGNFVGIKTYLDANKKQAGNLGNQIGGVIGNSASQARTGVQNLNNEFNTKAGSSVGIDQDALKATEGTGAINDQQKQTLQNQLGAQYGGPADLQALGGYGDVNKNVGTAVQNLKGAGTEEGRKSLIGQVNNKARSAGMTNFDSALVQSGVGRNNIANAVNANKDAMNLDQTLAQNNMSAQQKAADITAQDAATRNATSGAINTNFSKLYDALGIRQKGAQDKQSKEVEDMKNSLMANDPRITDPKLLGLNNGDSIYDINLGDYAGNVTPGDTDISLADVAGDDESAKLNALNELVGQSNFNLGKKEGSGGAQFSGAKDLKDRVAQSQKDYQQQAATGGWLAKKPPSGATITARDFIGETLQRATTPESAIQTAQLLRNDMATAPHLAAAYAKDPRVQSLLDYADKYKNATNRRVGSAGGDNTFGGIS